MLKRYLIMFSTLMLLNMGCENHENHPVNQAMRTVSSALQSRDITVLRPLLSAQTTDAVDEVFKALSTLHKTAKSLPEHMRQDVIGSLPKSVVTENSSVFLQELTAESLTSLKMDEGTLFGLEVDAINQESEKSATVVTKSGEKFPFSLEKTGWKIHLFKEPLSELLKKTRTLQQAINLTIERVARRAQIESVLQSAEPKSKPKKR